MENSESDANIRPPDLPLEKPVYRSGSKVRTGHRNNRLVPSPERSTSRLYIVTMIINLYAEYIMKNAGFDEAQAGIKIGGININNHG